MCLAPLNIITPKKYISRQGGTPFVLTVPCGHCAECATQKRSEYFMRSYYEAKYTFDKGGFMLFDTLTYANHTLPHLSDSIELFKNSIFDYPCFSRQHIRLFLVLLREHLSNKGYLVKDNLKYFLSCEYGTSEFHTHRPHYHILFYSTIPNLDPLVLSQEISVCWPHGRTDGVPYQTEQYVRENRVYSGDDPFATESACNYVSKYVVKQSSFESVVNSRVDAVYQRWQEYKEEPLLHFVTINDDGDYIAKNIGIGITFPFRCNDSDAKKRIKKVINRLCMPFHCQSHHFGESALTYNDLDEVYNTGMMKYYTCKDVVKFIPIPTYFARKLFYELVDDFRGEKVWQLTEFGKEYKFSRISYNIKSLSKRIHDTFENYRNSPNCSPFFEYRFSTLLGNRSLDDFAIYLALYKGRIASENYVKDCTLSDWVYRTLWYDYTLSGKWFANYTSSNDREYFNGVRTLTNRYIGDAKHGWHEPPEIVLHEMEYHKGLKFDYVDVTNIVWAWPKEIVIKGYQSCDIDKFIRYYVIDQSFHPSFDHFDELYNLFVSIQLLSNPLKQKAYELKERLTENRKNLKNLHYIN